MRKEKDRLMWCTTVNPLEYNIEEQMKGIIQNSNACKNSFIPTDAGKVIGLYNHWKECQEAMREVYKLAWELQGNCPDCEKLHKICDSVNDLLPND